MIQHPKKYCYYEDLNFLDIQEEVNKVFGKKPNII